MTPPIDDSPLPKIPVRPNTSHKGDFGKLILIGGSRGMAGAIALSGMAALRSGAGLVRLVVPDEVLATVAGFEPSYMTQGMPTDENGCLQSLGRFDFSWATSAAIGPGIGGSQNVRSLVYDVIANVKLPLVVDADGLNALSTNLTSLEKAPAPRVLTPHPGEFQRLTGIRDERLGHDDAFRAAAACEFAARFKNVIVMLKGARSVVTDGNRVYQNTTGNPGMATGGCGDVLTGVVATLLGQGFTPYDASRVAVYLHGLAGDLAARHIGPIGLIARDLLTFIPLTIQQHMAAT
jgi:NAD(P)H-hydrate epimerase